MVRGSQFVHDDGIINQKHVLSQNRRKYTLIVNNRHLMHVHSMINSDSKNTKLCGFPGLHTTSIHFVVLIIQVSTIYK